MASRVTRDPHNLYRDFTIHSGNADFNGDLDVDGTTNLDIVDIDGAVQLDATLTIGADDQGYDVIFYGDTDSSNMTWDTSEDDLVLNDSRLYINQDDSAQGIYIDSETLNGIEMYCKLGLYIEQDVPAGRGAYITRDIAEAGSHPLVQILDVNDNNTQPALKIQQEGAGYGISIDHNANSSALYIDADGVTSGHTFFIDAPTTTTGRVLLVDDCASLTTGSAALFTTSSTAMATTINGGFVHIKHTGDSDTNVNNLLLIENDDAGSTGTTCLKIQQDSTGKAISATGGIVEEGGVLKENLLSNSGFDVWSESTLETAAVMSADAMTSDGTGGWSEESDTTLDFVAAGGGEVAHYTLAQASGWRGIKRRDFTLTIGKLYEWSIDIKDGVGTNVPIDLYLENASSEAGLNPTTDGDWETYSVIFEAKYADDTFVITDGYSFASNIKLRNFYIHEVTPGCVGSNALAPDGWWKEDTADIWRQEPHATYTKDGSYYSLKLTAGSTNDFIAAFKGGFESDDVHVARFAGRTVTMGVWAWTATGSHARIKLSGVGGSGSDTYSSYHTGGSGWEWLEVTKTFASNITSIYFYLRANVNAATVWYSHPMLVYGSSIGEGNYTRPQGEIVWMEKTVASNLFTGAAFSDVSVVTLNVEVDSDGAIPKGAKAVIWQGNGRDSGSAGADCYFHTRMETTQSWAGTINPAGLANDAYARSGAQWQACDLNGDFDYVVEATGSSTFDIYLEYKGVQLR